MLEPRGLVAPIWNPTGGGGSMADPEFEKDPRETFQGGVGDPRVHRIHPRGLWRLSLYVSRI